MNEIILLNIKAFFLILTRISIVVIFLPLLGYRNIPTLARIAIILAISYIVFTKIQIKEILILKDNILFFILLLKEALVGFILSLIVQLPFIAVRITGEIISFKTLFSISAILDPSQEQRSTLWAEFFVILAIFIFLSTGAINIFLKGLIYSFKVLSIEKMFTIKSNIVVEVTKVISDIIFIGVAISMPVVITLLITNISLGIISKSMMNFNVFFIGIPMQILLAILIIIFSIETNSMVIKNIYEYIFKKLDLLIKLI